MFGRAYSQIGNSKSDVLIKTRGQIKIQWGTKFIDLIKDGKINADSSCIFTVESIDKIGVKDGFYVIDDSIYLKIGDSPPLNLIGEVGTTYVSFLEQETTSEQKYTALQNIGFIYKDMDSISDNSLKNGIIYLESEQKLYIVKDGNLTEFTITFPNPLAEQFIISKSDNSKGALLIKGQGINNSLAFEKLFIYNEEEESYIDSDGDLYFRIGQDNKIIISDNKVTFVDPIIASIFQSPQATDTSGFRLYLQGSQSVLEVDRLLVRYPEEDPISMQVYPTYWYSKNNIIEKIEIINEQDEENPLSYKLQLIFKNQYKEGDSLYTYSYTQKESILEQVKLPFTVMSLDKEDENIIQVQINTDLDEDASISELLDNLRGHVTFLVGSIETPEKILRRSDNGIDLIESSNFEDEVNLKSIQTRLGNLAELELAETEEGNEIPIEGYGTYSKQSYFEKAGYTKGYILPDTDNSSKMASTEWVRKLVGKSGEQALPNGTIIAYHGDVIPDGWTLCNGDNGTPNLVGKFIRADVSEGEGDEVEVTAVDTQEGENQLVVKISPTYYSLVFIMKTQ